MINYKGWFSIIERKLLIRNYIQNELASATKLTSTSKNALFYSKVLRNYNITVDSGNGIIKEYKFVCIFL
jgi:hypothetical protein